MKIRPIAIAVSLALPVLLSACGGSKVEPRVVPPEPEPKKAENHGPKMQVATELGEIDKKETIKTFERLKGTFLDCHKKGLERVEYMEGDVKFFLRVGQDGFARYAYLEDSTLGDHDTEKCMLDAITAMKWPKPQGGEAEVRSGTGFDAPNVRPPAPWTSDKIATVIAKESAGVNKCKAGAAGKYHVTLYVQPHGTHGKVQAVGMSWPSKDAAHAAECLSKEVLSWDMPSPGSWAAKVSFDL